MASAVVGARCANSRRGFVSWDSLQQRAEAQQPGGNGNHNNAHPHARRDQNRGRASKPTPGSTPKAPKPKPSTPRAKHPSTHRHPQQEPQGPQGTAVALARQMQDWQHWQRQLTITIFAFLIFKGHLQTPCKQIQPTPTSSLLQATCQQRLLRNLTGQQTPTVTS